MSDALTPDEQDLIQEIGDLYNGFAKVVGHGDTRQYDLAEIAALIHGLQTRVMAQAAARAYPQKLRLLGESLPGPVAGQTGHL